MDDGKPTGPKAKWWSRPSAGRAVSPEPEVPPARGDGATTSPLPRTDDASADVAADAPVDVPVPADQVPTRSGPAPVAADEGWISADPAPVPADPLPLPADPPSPSPGAAPPPSGPARASVGEGPVPRQGRPQPLHEPDEYSTPPYGGPGPWALAPPVQRPTPAHGTQLPPVPPPYAASHGAHDSGTVPPAPPVPQPPQDAAQPHPQGFRQPGSGSHPQPQSPAAAHPPFPASQWLQYDPWSSPGSAPGQQPLTQYGEPRPKRRRAGLAAALLLGFAACVVGGAAGAYVERNGGLTSVELPQSSGESGGRAPDSVAGIAASALPSVVTLHVSGNGEQGTGTGFVLDRQGHILTNNHVVSPASSAGEISVTFSGGETAKAELVGNDSGYDLAVVKVTGVSGLKPLPLGNSDAVRVGDPVVAIGAPFDLSNTVTSGIISAKERPITAGGEKGDGSDISYVDALQTDAPINPGNSGGPLVDARARVIGINSAIRAADSGSGLEGGQSGSIGLGFAIPINQGKRVAEELINTGRATHPVIGVSLDMDYAGDGARVGAKAADGGPAVTTGGPGAKAGIRPGDVITEVNGQRVHSGEELIVKIRAHRPGDRLRLTVVRGGKERPVTLALGSASGT
ncbi:trypsin-like peptidase domain-containing protein [Streptomyces sp. NPDC088116]|uniref:S1C family serine protease n=1 Tax=Streptomyces sp. NPDC088116 TaxID=3365825 RepID=UPI0037FBABF2